MRFVLVIQEGGHAEGHGYVAREREVHDLGWRRFRRFGGNNLDGSRCQGAGIGGRLGRRGLDGLGLWTFGKCVPCEPSEEAGQDKQRGAYCATTEHAWRVHEGARAPQRTRASEGHESTSDGEHDGAYVDAVKNGSVRDRGENFFLFEKNDFDELTGIDALVGDASSTFGEVEVSEGRVASGFGVDGDEVLPMVGDKPCFFFELASRGLFGRFAGIDDACGKFTADAAGSMSVLIDEHDVSGVGEGDGGGPTGRFDEVKLGDFTAMGEDDVLLFDLEPFAIDDGFALDDRPGFHAEVFDEVGHGGDESNLRVGCARRCRRVPP